MVHVDMRVAHGVDELARLQPTHMGNHQGQQGIRGDIERNAKPHVAAALIQHAAQLAAAGAAGRKRHVELRKHVAGGQGHLGDVGRVPRAQDDAAVVRVLLQRVDYPLQLVDALAAVVGVRALVGCAEVPPLEPIDGPEVAYGAGREAERVEVAA